MISKLLTRCEGKKKCNITSLSTPSFRHLPKRSLKHFLDEGGMNSTLNRM